MSDYIIGPLLEESWRISLDAFSYALLQEWPDTDIKHSKEADIALRWILGISNSPLLCSLHVSGQAIFVEGGNVKDYAILALWFRRLVPAEHQLFLYHIGLTQKIGLTTTTTEGQIIEELGY